MTLPHAAMQHGNCRHFRCEQVDKMAVWNKCQFYRSIVQFVFI